MKNMLMKTWIDQRGPRVLVLATALLQALSPLLFRLSGSPGLEGESSGPAITPAGYAFIVWGAITGLAFAYGVYQVFPRKNQTLFRQISLPLSAVYGGFSLWLLAASQQWLWATVVIFGGMLFFLWRAYDRVIAGRIALSPVEVVLLAGQLGLYTGWTSIAVFANLAAALKNAGLSDVGSTGMLWQGLLLLGATLNGLYGIRRSGGSLFYTATVLWAFVGVLIGLNRLEGTQVLQVCTGIAIAATVSFFAHVHYKPHGQPRYS